MIRNHSIIASVIEIVKMSKNADVVKVNIVGNPSTGKTELGKTLGHLIHKIAFKMYEMPFAVKLFDQDSLLNFEDTLRTLQPVNHILIFDDVSFLGAHATKSQIEIAKQAMTKIRHLPGGSDIKVVQIQNFHYTLGMDKWMRQNDFSYYTSIGSSELENMQRIVGVKYTPMLLEFQRMLKTAQIKERFAFKLGNKGKVFIYAYRKPFIPVLFHNGHSLRFVVSPLREWIDPLCNTCIVSKKATLAGDMDIEKLKKDMDYKFGKQISKTAVRLMLHQNGVNVFPKRVKQCITYLSKYMEHKIFNLQQMADSYGFRNDQTRLGKKLPDEIQSKEQADMEEKRATDDVLYDPTEENKVT